MIVQHHCKYQRRQKYLLSKRFVNVTMHQVFKWLRSNHCNSCLLFLDISAIYNNFLTELWRLRLIAARETVEVINSAESTISGDILGQTPIKLAAEVCGLGPVFRIYLIIENMSARKIAADLCVLLHCDHRHYLLKKPYQMVNMDFHFINRIRI